VLIPNILMENRKAVANSNKKYHHPTKQNATPFHK